MPAVTMTTIFFLLLHLKGKDLKQSMIEKGKKWSHKFLKKMCGIIQRIPANISTPLHPPP
jgi:hypothetical protein